MIAWSFAQTQAKNTIIDVTEGQEIRGIVTDSSAVGYAKVTFIDESFTLDAGFTGLTDPLGDDFYEWWLVRKSPFAFISTGKLVKKDGKYHNAFLSTTDYSDYDQYVLTIEPNDGNDAPADHILEGPVTMAWVQMPKDEVQEMKNKMMKDKEKMMSMKKMTAKQQKIAMKIQARIKNLSDEKKAILLERVKNLQSRVATLDISDTKKAAYNEILEVFVDVLMWNTTMETEMMKTEMMDK